MIVNTDSDILGSAGALCQRAGLDGRRAPVGGFVGADLFQVRPASCLLFTGPFWSAPVVGLAIRAWSSLITGCYGSRLFAFRLAVQLLS